MRHLKLIFALIFAVGSHFAHSQMMEAPEWNAEVLENSFAKGD
ncbi:MAG TPA: hypothetical protein DC015_09235, partial [Aequorivita sp.]|nr:hypothetical protein [Aequorivita sp.]